MSRAFTKEDESGDVLGGIGERPISAHRNLATPDGIAAMDREILSLREELAKGPDRERVAHLSRDLRYWTARRETAELSVPETGSDVVRFGMTVGLESEDGRAARWRIVGEDEADAAQGSISHVSPMARALFGKGVGDVASVNGVEWEITALES
ncbi:MAG: GreA/GreB family elongation factor [Methylobacterium mesophilicum]|nr:GreA/GreB family elongation factor [Methylobacterium mesophilicum]